jgi:ABC-type proline/glycine betaine transport system substrate-binding protein
MTKNMKRFLIFGALLAIGTALFAQNAESDFETKANTDGTVTITRYIGWDTEMALPAKIGGKTVTAIGKEAFKGAGLTEVTIPAGIVSIENSAFQGNKLTSVVIPEGVTKIGGHAMHLVIIRLKALPLPGALQA